MADKILKQNKIPGCERLTRPEEIKALSKYLRHIKEELEERTDLDDTALEIPGKTTGQFHSVSELPQGKETIDPGHNISALETERLGLEDKRTPRLSDYLDELEDKRDTKLSNFQDIIEDNREIGLENYKERIENQTEPELSSYKDNISDSRNPELSDYKDTLEDKRNPELSTYKELIEDSGISRLSDYLDELEDKRDTKLSNFQDIIEDNREIGLENYKERIENQTELELSDYKENLENTLDPKLSNYKDTIEDNRENSLSDHKDTLESPKEVELSDYKNTIEDEREPKLSDYKESLEDKSEPSLVDYKETLEDLRESKLSDYKDTILDDDREPELSDYKENISDEREISLGDYKEVIEDSRNPKLSEYKDNISDERENSLSDYRDNLEDTREPELSDYKDTIQDEREPELSNYKDTILDEREPELSNFVDTLEDNNEPSLEDYKDTILDEKEPELEDYKDELGEINEVESLYDSVIGLDDTREPELSNYKDTLEDNNEPSLEDYKDTTLDDREPELSNFKDTIQDENEPELSDYKDTILDEREPSLSDYLDSIDDPREPELEDYQDTLEDNNEPFLENYKDPLSDPREPELSDYQDTIQDDREPELDDTVILKDATYNPETGTFSTDGVARTDGDYDYIDNSLDYNNADPIIQQKAKKKFERHQEVLEKPDNENPIFNNEWNIDGSPGYYGSWDDVIPKLTDDREPELSEEKIEKPLSENPSPIYDQLLNLPENDLYNLVLQLLDGNSTLVNQDAEWNQKIASLVSTYLQPHDERDTLIQPQNAHRFEDELFRSINLVGVERDQGGEYRPKVENVQGGMSRNSDGTARIDGDYDFIDIYTSNLESEQNRARRHTKDEYKYVPLSDIPQDSTELMVEYIRYIAEQSVGVVDGNSIRKYLLEEVLWTLILTRRLGEEKAEINRDRLPGHSKYRGVGTLVDEIYQAIQDGNLLTTATNFIFRYLKEKPNPINRPEINPDNGKKYDTYYFTSANSRYSKNQNEGDAGVFKNLWERIISNLSGELPSGDYIFSDNYLQGGGIMTTLKDLCKATPESIWSVEDLMETLKKSEYITTPSKFGTIHEGSYGTQTLDSNSYWEVIIEPFCDDYLNGNYSYLPCFNEINVINASVHGVQTSYNKWVPISNFELQKSKLTTKSIGLYDGEFSIPISAELTNEIRFTIVDDQYKSWRNYFQKCMDVAVYSSTPHNGAYYKDGGIQSLFETSISNLVDAVTPVDKSMICVALYKNISFRIRIYIMTPQYSTIRRFDLLCVLKDFSEEYSGDIDSGGVDLNVTFSIVGENPEGADQAEIRDDYIEQTYILENIDEDLLSMLPEENIDEDEWYLNHNGTSIFGGG